LDNILEVEHLTTAFAGQGGAAVEDVSFSVGAGETVCIVGESGCGKSVSCLSLLGLLPRGGKVTAGRALFAGQDLLAMTEKQLDTVRGAGIGMIFQDALSALNPVFTIGNQLTESIRAHLPLDAKQAKERAQALLAKAGLPDPAAMMKKYPHTLSGGQRQRVMIAMALACDPKLLIADEPTTALDVTIQAQIMALLKKLQAENGMSILLITHDIGLVAQMADRVLVMYAGQIVEQAEVHTLFRAPAHPYTKALLHSVPDFSAGMRRLDSIRGTVPERYQEIKGCRFASRCPYAAAECAVPQSVRALSPGHKARCRIAKETQA
jgi:peptide/nickel transport system ATP-binding protein